MCETCDLLEAILDWTDIEIASNYAGDGFLIYRVYETSKDVIGTGITLAEAIANAEAYLSQDGGWC